MAQKTTMLYQLRKIDTKEPVKEFDDIAQAIHLMQKYELVELIRISDGTLLAHKPDSKKKSERFKMKDLSCT